ncbi:MULTISPECIES: hypothetical protein [Vibrio]|uniref:hypothetical protein n=1 Tax=Vibrio TaxID=662 RepID=UPI001CDD748F|nr:MULTISPECIES: hypothetical protein [Vibrio]MCA2438576.1 hypothetical protein [Vibrio alginolyticus]MDW1729484.1 hypothetical protein [Vibrio sp. Vb2356]MDW1931170.1 hypothetical protein [Vibrio sp. 970]
MKISEIFNLGTTQFEVDFVDIDIDTDTPLFVDPFFLGTRPDFLSTEASRTLRSFFQTFVSLVRTGSEAQARSLFNNLHEPNETCLGLSRGRPRGNAIGEVDGDKLFQSIVQSDAVKTGIVEDLEDFRLFIDGIDKDKISDMTTNIIRRHLIEYTQAQCRLWGIPLQDNVQSGICWDASTRSWINFYTEMLVIEGRKILLTPKNIVSYAKKYTPQKYFNHFVLEYLQREHITSGSFLVQHRRDGTPYVTKKSLKETVAEYSKDFLANFTDSHPDVFADFKDWVTHNSEAIKNEEIVEEDPIAIAEYLIEKLNSVPSGSNDATLYHRVVVGILEFLFYPDVISPIVEQEIHDGRKRIDITFDNAAINGFFYRLHTTYQTPAQFIFVECKNYTKEVVNPEFDQLAGRFSVNRGKVGLLLCRQTDNMDLLLDRCNDTYVDGRGIMLPIVDADLVAMLRNVIDEVINPYEQLLSDKFRSVALR